MIIKSALLVKYGPSKAHWPFNHTAFNRQKFNFLLLELINCFTWFNYIVRLFVCLRMQICNRICQLNVILLWSTSDGWRDKLKNWGWCLRLPRVTNSEIHLFSFHSTLISVNIVRHLNKFEICLCFATFIIAGTAAERAYQWQHF